jgi:hypothetical protein
VSPQHDLFRNQRILPCGKADQGGAPTGARFIFVHAPGDKGLYLLNDFFSQRLSHFPAFPANTQESRGFAGSWEVSALSA